MFKPQIQAQEFAFPQMIPIRQALYAAGWTETQIVATVQDELAKIGLANRVRRGQTIAIGVGSRGIAHIAQIIKTVVQQIRAEGATPFVFPAMGSHGGGTAQGQCDVLAALGITSAYLGCDIRSSMEVVELGQIGDGLPVYLDQHAFHADGIIIVNRIKPHTDFRGKVESGLMKMLTIGAGKDTQAKLLHAYGVRGLRELMPEAGRLILSKANIIAGLGILEDGYHQVAKIVGVAANELEQTEVRLLQEARQMMPSLPIRDLDILIVDQIGKNISGTGMDTNIIGRIEPSEAEADQTPTIPLKIRVVQGVWGAITSSNAHTLSRPTSVQHRQTRRSHRWGYQLSTVKRYAVAAGWSGSSVTRQPIASRRRTKRR